MFYRFKSGVFIKGATFEECKETLLARISEEKETTSNWHKCTCLGLEHRFNCPERPKNVF